jgi:hypothetical protein
MAEHKDPKDRAHVWERPARADEAPAETVSHDYHLELPRFLHKHGEESIVVRTPAEADEALANGYHVNLNDMPAEEEPKKSKKGK